MSFTKKNIIKYYAFLLIISFCGGVLFIFPDFITYPTSGIGGVIYTFFHWALTCFALFLLYYILSINKYFFSFTFPILVFVGSLVGFYSYFYKASLTPMIVDAAFNNDIGTSLDVITPLLIIIVLICFIFSVIIVIYRFKHIVVQMPFLHFVGAILSLILLFSINERTTNTFFQHYPFSLYYNLNEYNNLKANKNEIRINPDSTLNYKSEDEVTVVFVIGESLRADHLSLNGYKRKTTPLLEKRKNVISFSNIYSEFTYTNPSIAHIMSRADSINAERAYTEKSFITQFNTSGYYTAWLANQDAASSYYSFMKECDTLIYVRPEKSVFTYSSWLDLDLLSPFDNELLNPDKNKLLILHTIGSHWYYNSHYSDSFKLFNPTTQSKILSQNSSEEIINSYDNTVVYTDYILDSIIKRLEKLNAVLIFLSDHGEALGEGGNWLHAGENEYLKNPACFIWFSNQYQKKFPLKIQSLYENMHRRYRTDFLYHSILSAGNIPSKMIETDFDIFSKTD